MSMNQHLAPPLCEWADYPAEPPHEKCDRPAEKNDAYSTQEGGSVELWLCAEHDHQIHGSTAVAVRAGVKQHLAPPLCAWAEYPAEPPHEKCDRPAEKNDAYSTQEGGSVELWLCAEHDRQIHGDPARRAAGV